MHNQSKNTKKDVDNYTKIYELFTVKELLTTNNPIRDELNISKVTFDKSTNSIGSKAEQYRIVDKFGQQRILLYDGTKQVKTQEGTTEIIKEKAFYKNCDRLEDKGDLFQFIKNRIEGNSARAVFNLLNKHDFYNKAIEWKSAVEINYAYFKKASTITKPFQKEDYSNLRSITEDIQNKIPHFLETRGIDNEILLSSKFKDRVYVYDHTDSFNRVHKNILFPKFENQELKGAEIKPTKGKGYCFGRDELLWCSNKPDKVDKILIVESALNAISHYQLFKVENTNTWYFSTNGNFYESRIDHLLKQVELNEIDIYSAPIVMATDNDFDGSKYEISFLNRFLEKENQFHIDDNFGPNRAISFYTRDPKLRSEVHKVFMKLSAGKKGYDIHADDKKIYLTYPSKEELSKNNQLISDIKASLPFTKDIPMGFEKAIKWNDWNDVVQYDFDITKFENLEVAFSLLEKPEPNILLNKGISNDILLDDSFQNRVYIFDNKLENKDVHKAVFYPKFKDDIIVGAEITSGKSLKHAGSLSHVWCSKKPVSVDKVVIVEHPINALSHKQLDTLSNRHTWYFSTGQNSGNKTIELIYKELLNANIDLKTTKLEIATDNNVWSINVELAFLNKIQQDGYFRLIYAKEPNTIAFRSNENKTEEFNAVKKFFSQVKSKLNEVYLKAGENSFIKVTTTQNEVQIRFPNTNKLKRISHTFTNSLKNNVDFLKSKNLSINKTKSGQGNNHHERLQLKLGIKQTQNTTEQKKKYQYNIKMY